MSDSEGEQEKEGEPATLASTRTRRDNAGKRKQSEGKFAALQRLKEARKEGRKMNYEVAEIENVYDVVGEDEYADAVERKRGEDWIVDDDGGYVEDGREIFDEEEADLGYQGKAAGKAKGEKVKKEGKAGGNIRNMLLAMPSRKAEEQGKLEEDELLGDILSTIDAKKTKVVKEREKKVAARVAARVGEGAEAERNPFMKKGTGLTKVVKRPAAAAEGVKEEKAELVEEVPAEDNVMDGFDEEMNFDDEMTEEVKEEVKAEVKEEEGNRGFVTAKMETGSQGAGQWMSSTQGAQVKEEEVVVDTSSLPTTTVTEEGEEREVVRMYWLDAHEDPYKHPGSVWLFGKVAVGEGKFVSCCATVKNIPRRIYLAKRDVDAKTGAAVTAAELYEEFNTKVARRYKITDFKCRPVEKSYAFEHADVANQGTYLEVVYGAQFPALPADLQGDTFSRVFGTPQTSLEHLLLQQRIKGPGWLDLHQAAAVSAQVSWCRLEATVPGPDMVRVSACTADMPPLTTLSLKLATVINPKTQQNEVAMAGVLAHTAYSLASPGDQLYNQHFCILTKPADEAWPFDWAKTNTDAITEVKKAATERELLSLLLMKVAKLDPDIIIGHDVSTFDLEVLTHRMVKHKIPNWSKLGRLRRSNQAELGKRALERQATVGRLVADLKVSAKELIRCKSYELGALVEKCLREGTEETRTVLTPDTVRRAYSSSAELRTAVMMVMRDADQTLKLMVQLQALPLAVQITQIVGTVLSKTLRGGRAERIEYLLLHAFTQLGYVVPDKQWGKRKVGEEEEGEAPTTAKGRKKPSYAGGLVLDPKKGFYDKFILLLDFNSLYPSIIQEYNICFTTVSRERQAVTAEGEQALPGLPDASAKPGVLPTQIKKLVDSRREVKALLKADKLTAAQKASLNIRQLALKLTANSMYGCLGFSFSRFFAKPLAALVTMKGREILLQTRDLIQKMNLDVIYGDTDSVMVNTNSTDYDEVFRLGREIKQNVNKLYRLLELDIDGVYKYMLLLKKKKYAAVTVEKDPKTGKLLETTELKGLDIVRRDWSQLAADSGRRVIQVIMSDTPEDVRLAKIQALLEETRDLLLQGKVALKDLAITKALTKDPADYADKKALPHVQVALRMNSAGGKKLRAGDTVQYVICEDGSGLAPTQRAYHVEEVKARQELRVDTTYYLAQQLHPVVARLTEPIQGMEGARVASCLGLDPEQYRSRAVEAEQGAQEEREEDKYRYVDHLEVACVCGERSSVTAATVGDGRAEKPWLGQCPAARGCGGWPAQREGAVSKAIDLLVRGCLARYYQGWLVCEDPGCSGRTRTTPLQFQRAYPVCPTCSKASMYAEYSPTALYTQLQYLLHILDVPRMKARAAEANEFRNNLVTLGGGAAGGLEKVYSSLRERVSGKWVAPSAYATVTLSKLFEGLPRERRPAGEERDLAATPAHA